MFKQYLHIRIRHQAFDEVHLDESKHLNGSCYSLIVHLFMSELC